MHAIVLQETRANIKRDKEQGKSFKQKLEDLKKMSSGNSFLCGNNIVGKNHLLLKQEADNKGIEVKLEILQKEERELNERKKKAYQKVLSKKPDYLTWNADELYVVNQLLKHRRNDGGAIPKSKVKGREKYLSWKDRESPNYPKLLHDLTSTKTVFDNTGGSNSNNTDVIGKVEDI